MSVLCTRVFLSFSSSRRLPGTTANKRHRACQSHQASERKRNPHPLASSPDSRPRLRLSSLIPHARFSSSSTQVCSAFAHHDVQGAALQHPCTSHAEPRRLTPSDKRWSTLTLSLLTLLALLLLSSRLGKTRYKGASAPLTCLVYLPPFLTLLCSVRHPMD